MATNIINTVKKYDTQAKCLSYLQKLRWGKTVKCPICLKNKVRSVGTKQGQYFCKTCKEQFSIFTGTIFEGTVLPLPKWFASIALVLKAKSTQSVKEVAYA